MYKTRLEKWGVKKYNRSCDALAIYRINKQRAAQGKRSVIRLGNRVVDIEKVEAYLKRHKETSQAFKNGEPLPNGSTPPDLSCETPMSILSPETEIELSGTYTSADLATPDLSNAVILRPQGCLEGFTTSEKIFASARNYLQGKIDSGCWFWDYGILAKGAQMPLFRRRPVSYVSSGILTASCGATLSLFHNGRFDTGGELLRNGLAELSAVIRGEDPSLLSNILCSLSTWSLPGKSCDFSHVQKLVLQAVVDVCRIVFGPQHPLAVIFANMTLLKDWKQVLARASQAIMDIIETRLGSDHNHAIDTRMSLANELMNVEDAHGAEEVLLPLVDLMVKQVTVNFKSVSRVHGYLAYALFQQGNSERAINALQRCFEAELYLGDPELTCDRYLLLHYCQYRMNSPDAEATLLRAVHLSSTWLGQAHPCTIRNVGALEYYLRELGRYEEAEIIGQLFFARTPSTGVSQ